MKTGYEGHKVIEKFLNVTVEKWCDCKDGLHYEAIEKELK